MDEGKIFVVNLSRGLIGEDNAAILGAMLVTKIQLAAMSRADIPRLEDRRPFYLYVDEFQNFATDSFAVILSEARKYALNLTIANQYISQMEETVRGAVFGNVGTMITFRVSPDDSPFLIKYYEPQFEASDLSNFHNRHFVTSMSINGEKAAAFSGTTLNIPQPQSSNMDAIVAFSRQNYSSDRSHVEDSIRQQTLGDVAKPVQAHNTIKTDVHLSKLVAIPLPITRPEQSISQPEPTAKLSESQKRRLRRKRAAEATKDQQQVSSQVTAPLPEAVKQPPDDTHELKLR